ncbi:DUF6788 family protein [Alkalinema sp. FACHB-956]|uniref:DUF6788 family protein n=1 Tax=Alkalinema sp. FACHB-956 TaxID=2692768 RepID=UPI001684BE33|nr:DUF6788 family protein [Alkalinema sp. FACHB-956]MBD2328067.1 hypothetical protein [Alkalinema sp. FACHB-956]
MPPRSPLRSILKQAEALSIVELESLSQSIEALLLQRRSQAETVELPTPNESLPEIAPEPSPESPVAPSAEARPNPLHGWREEYRKCGKPNCWCAQGEKSHGPYWYRSVRKEGKVTKEYWGRYLRAQQTSTEAANAETANVVEAKPDAIVE